MALGTPAERERHRTRKLRLVVADGVPGADLKLAAGINLCEAKFVNRALVKKWEILRAGWPDFLCDTGKGWVGIEVKAYRLERLRKSQVAMFEALEAFGLRIYVWSGDDPGKLRPWKAHQVAAMKAKRGRKKATWGY